jgi:hypothetical protein
MMYFFFKIQCEEVKYLQMALRQENREKLKMKKEKDNALQKIRDQNKENEVFSMRLDSAIDELFQVKLLSGSKDKEIISLKEEIKNLQMTLEQENPEKLKVNERNTQEVSSDVINNQEKEIKCLKVSLDQEKEGKEEALLKNKEQSEGFWKEITYLKRQVKCLEMANQAKLKILQEKDTRETALSMSKDREAKKDKEDLKAKDQEISKISIELGSKSLELECRNKEKLQNEKILQDNNNFIKSLKNIIDMDAKILQEKHQALTEASKQLIEKNAAVSEAKEKNEQEKVQHLNHIESLRYELANEIKCLKDELERAHYDINTQYAEITFLNKEVNRLDDSLSKAMIQEKRNVQEIVKHVIEIERLKAELAREMHKSRCAGILLEKKGKTINLDDIKVKVDEFNCMKDMIRNNLEVNCLNVTFEVNNS